MSEEVNFHAVGCLDDNVHQIWDEVVLTFLEERESADPGVKNFDLNRLTNDER